MTKGFLFSIDVAISIKGMDTHAPIRLCRNRIGIAQTLKVASVASPVSLHKRPVFHKICRLRPCAGLRMGYLFSFAAILHLASPMSSAPGDLEKLFDVKVFVYQYFYVKGLPIRGFV